MSNLMKPITRCAWVSEDPLYIEYHDHEWGIPIYEDRLLFEFLVLEGMQAGLSWLTILKRRDSFRAAFDNFNPEIVAHYHQDKIDSLLRDPGIIRNRLKVEAAINNAKIFLEIQKERGDFSNYLWHFVDGKPVKNAWLNNTQLPTTSEISNQMAVALKKRGFKFVGSTICYALMQAVGMVNDHTQDCFLCAKNEPPAICA